MRIWLKAWLQRWRMTLVHSRTRRRALLAACTVASLATSWDPASAATVHLEVTPTETLSPAYAVYYNKNSSGVFWFPLGTLTGGQTSSFDHDFPGLPNSAFDPSPPFNQYWEPVGYGIVGVHGEGDNRGGTFSFKNDDPIVAGETFESQFTARNGFSEASFLSILDSLPSFSASWVNSFDDILKVPYGSPATLVSFSDAGFAGTAIATVPEPTSWVLMVLAGGVFVVAARRVRS